MKKITFYLVLLLFCFSGNVFSQSNFSTIPSKSQIVKSSTLEQFPNFADAAIANDSRCGTVPAVKYRVANDPLYAQYYNATRQIPKLKSQSTIICNASNTTRIPVAFHFDEVFDCGDVNCIINEVNDQMDAMRIGFGNNTGTPQEAACPAAYQDNNGNSVASTGTCIEFYMPIPPAATGLDACDLPITVGQFNGGLNGGGNGAGAAWAGILNIFITNNQCLGVADGIPGNANGDGVTVCRQAFGGFGGPSGACQLDTDNTYGLGATLIHEIGHYLGLFHTHHDSFNPQCVDNDTNAPGPFNVNDTPIQQFDSTGECPNGCAAGCTGTPEPIANFMAYTDDACMSMFTEDQAQVMNYWADQLFGNSNLPDADPNGSINTACGNVCNVVCPASVNTQYAGGADVCAGVNSYTLPSSFDASTPTTNTSLVLDVALSATFEWSTGNFISAGGTPIANTINLSSPGGCDPATQVYYLNVACSDGSIAEIDGGVFALNVYPDPAQFTAADLVTISGENTCNEPNLTANCAGVTITADAANPTFPVANGQSGTANYTIAYVAPAGTPNCCVADGGEGQELVTNGDFEAGTTGWTEVEEVPTGTPNPNPFGIIGVSNSLINGTNDAWFGGWGGTSTLTISQNITIPPTCGQANLTFDFLMSCAGDAGISLDVAINGVVLGTLTCTDGVNASIQSFDLIAAGAATGNVTLSFIGIEDGTGTNAPDIFIDNVSIITADCATPVSCEIPVTADFACSGTACAPVDLDILFDGFPSQTSWEILDAGGAVVASSGGTYSGTNGNTTVSESSCLFDGCYTLNFNDAIGNGLCPFRATASSLGTFITPGTIIQPGTIVATLGTVVAPGLCGNFALTDANGTTLASGGGSFGSLSSQQFCLSGGLANLWGGEDSNAYQRRNESTGLNVFPTLAKDNLSVQYLSQTIEPIQINILDVNGQIVQRHQPSTSQIQLNVSNLDAGIYFVHVVADGEVLVQKFIKY